MGPIGMGEIIVLFVLALLIFGPKKLPELGKTFGKGMAEFRRASNELKSTFQREMDNIERETKDVKTIAKDVSKDINKSYYDDNEDDYYSDYDYDGASIAKSTPDASAKPEDPGTGADQQQANASDESRPELIEQLATGSDEESQPADGLAAPAVSGVPEAESAPASKSA